MLLSMALITQNFNILRIGDKIAPFGDVYSVVPLQVVSRSTSLADSCLHDSLSDDLSTFVRPLRNAAFPLWMIFSFWGRRQGAARDRAKFECAPAPLSSAERPSALLTYSAYHRLWFSRLDKLGAGYRTTVCAIAYMSIRTYKQLAARLAGKLSVSSMDEGSLCHG